MEAYSGPFPGLYLGGKSLLEDGYTQWEASVASQMNSRLGATVLSVLTVILAAAAGITVLPSGISHWVSAAIAFSAAVVAGLNGVLNPEQKAGRAQTKVVLWEEWRDEVEVYLRRVVELKASDATSEIEEELHGLRQRRDSINFMS
jgi:apolipoprotein N-acyltransferase